MWPGLLSTRLEDTRGVKYEITDNFTEDAFALHSFKPYNALYAGNDQKITFNIVASKIVEHVSPGQSCSYSCSKPLHTHVRKERAKHQVRFPKKDIASRSVHFSYRYVLIGADGGFVKPGIKPPPHFSVFE